MANEYVAGCGKTPTGEYIFKCNAGSSNKSYDVYQDVDGNGKLNIFIDKLLTKDSLPILGKSSYHPCNATHLTKDRSDFIDGFIVDNGGHDLNLIGANNYKVVIWTEGGTNVHCTTNLEDAYSDVVRS